MKHTGLEGFPPEGILTLSWTVLRLLCGTRYNQKQALLDLSDFVALVGTPGK